MTKIAFFGECMLEQSKANSVGFGGDSLNTALYFARTYKKTATDDSAVIYYATGVGCDDESYFLLSCWQKEGINTELVKKITNKTLGRYCISTNEKGEREFSYQRDDSAAKYYFKQNTGAQFKDLLSKALIAGELDYFYFTGISLAILSAQDCQTLFATLIKYKARGGQVIFDNNYRPILWQNRDVIGCYQQAMALADMAFLTDEDEYSIYGGMAEGADSILKRYQTSAYQDCEIVIKQGDKPCIIRPAYAENSAVSTSIIEITAQVINAEKIIDTCAAGDAFAAGYLAKRLSGQSIEISAFFAHALAGRVIQYSGAIIPQSAMADLVIPVAPLLKNTTY